MQIPIKGGYILYPRVFLEITADWPLLDRVLWSWLWCKANHTDSTGYRRNLKRGQLFTSIKQLQNELSFKVGYRTKKPSAKQLRRTLEGLCEGQMIVTAKVTHGIVITICDYDFYQQPASYESPCEGLTKVPAKVQQGAKYKQELKNDKNEKKKHSSCSSSNFNSNYKTPYEMQCEKALKLAQENFLRKANGKG